jgi:HNH endonuclease
MFCPYCGRDHDETTTLSSEHVIPYAIGGPDELTIRVCEFSNNQLGGGTDRPVIEFFAVRSERFFLGLKGTDGTPPTLDLSGITYLQGREMRLKNVIGPDGKDMRLVGREVERTPTDDGERWNLRGSPEAIRKALAEKIRDQASKGKWVKNDRGEIITLENLDQMLDEAMEEVPNPCVLRKIEFEYLWTWRFFAKLALSIGHYLFGEEFSRSRRADELRRTMRAQTPDEAALKGAAIFPETHSLPPEAAQFKTKGAHTIVVCHGRPRLLMISLFGWLDACIVLDEFHDGDRMAVGPMQILEIALPDRNLSRYSLLEYIELRATRERLSAIQAVEHSDLGGDRKM